jgi:hypothetical protein
MRALAFLVDAGGYGVGCKGVDLSTPGAPAPRLTACPKVRVRGLVLLGASWQRAICPGSDSQTPRVLWRGAVKDEAHVSPSL